VTIPFVPMRGHILICDLQFGKIDPELGKERRVVVISPRSYNRRHGHEPGRCIIVPFSATAPTEETPAHVPFADDVYESLTEMTWALCDCVRSVSHARLNRVKAGGENLNEILSGVDLARIEVGLKHVLGIAIPAIQPHI
jgi:uncharacterized protein YifN (PemK superfamily)